MNDQESIYQVGNYLVYSSTKQTESLTSIMYKQKLVSGKKLSLPIMVMAEKLHLLRLSRGCGSTSWTAWTLVIYYHPDWKRRRKRDQEKRANLHCLNHASTNIIAQLIESSNKSNPWANAPTNMLVDVSAWKHKWY